MSLFILKFCRNFIFKFERTLVLYKSGETTEYNFTFSELNDQGIDSTRPRGFLHFYIFTILGIVFSLQFNQKSISDKMKKSTKKSVVIGINLSFQLQMSMSMLCGKTKEVRNKMGRPFLNNVNIRLCNSD